MHNNGSLLGRAPLSALPTARIFVASDRRAKCLELVVLSILPVLRTARGFLVPTIEREHPKLALEFERLSRVGLRIIGWVCIGAPALMYLLGILLLPTFPETKIIAFDLLQVMIGVVAVWGSYRVWVGPWARTLGMGVGASIGMIQSVSLSHAELMQESFLGDLIRQQFPTTIVVILLVGMAALPIKPAHNFALGMGLLLVFARILYVEFGTTAFSGWSAFPLVASFMIVVVSTALTAAMYHQRASGILARFHAEEGLEHLKQAQVSLLLARTAASKSRFAAAMSHEINSPLGALSSAFETLVKLVEGSDVPSSSRKAEVFRETARSGRLAYKRLSEITQRMKRLTNLDREEEQLVDLNQLCTDTVDSLRPQLEPKARIALELSPVPAYRCRPTQLSAVLTNLLRNAADALEGTGTIAVASERKNGSIWLEVRDDGRGIHPDRLETLFEPDFRVEAGRVATTNWGLFVSQSIVSTHGGSLSLSSRPGVGTTARVVLPLPG